MKCPKCGTEIDPRIGAAELGREGGLKSRRTLSTKQAKAMRTALTKKQQEAKK